MMWEENVCDREIPELHTSLYVCSPLAPFTAHYYIHPFQRLLLASDASIQQAEGAKNGKEN